MLMNWILKHVNFSVLNINVSNIKISASKDKYKWLISLVDEKSCPFASPSSRIGKYLLIIYY